jgi:hypothetical protein
MSFPAAIVSWEALKNQRDSGTDPALSAKPEKIEAKALIQRHATKSPVQSGKLRCELGAAWDYAMDAGRLPETAVNGWR